MNRREKLEMECCLCGDLVWPGQRHYSDKSGAKVHEECVTRFGRPEPDAALRQVVEQAIKDVAEKDAKEIEPPPKPDPFEEAWSPLASGSAFPDEAKPFKAYFRAFWDAGWDAAIKWKEGE